MSAAERVREALTVRHVLDEIHSHFMRVARQAGNSEALLETAERQWTETADAYAAAVRAETLAEVREVDVDDALILAVEEHVGMGCGAWDMVNASEIIRGAVRATIAKVEG